MLFIILIFANTYAFLTASTSIPAWAYGHWVWLDSYASNQKADLELVKGYLNHSIPVAAVNIDSRWSTGINNFVFDTTKFPDAKAMIAEFHKLNVKVIAWATSMVDTTSPNYQEGLKNNYYLNKGQLAKWWHGWGAFIDYTNPAALAWWHKQMDLVLNIGLDGWKCDGTDPITFELVYIESHAGHLSEREYADLYYRDFFFYTRQVRGNDTLIMARPVNDYWSFAPHNVMTSGWVGDDDPTFTGMKWALNDMLHSAWRGYANFGSDTGGYRGGGPKPLGRTKELLIRWAQLSAFCTLFENGGEGAHQPWLFGTDATAIYRTFVHLHMDLFPFFTSSGEYAMANNVSQMTPLGEDILGVYPTSFNYLLGQPKPSIFVAPITEDNVRSAKVDFPGDSSVMWASFFHNNTYKGGSSATVAVPLAEFTAFKRVGSLIPLDVKSKFSLHGDELQAGHLTLLLHNPALLQRDVKESTDVYEYHVSGLRISYSYKHSTQSLRVRFVTQDPAGYSKPVVLLLRHSSLTSAVPKNVKVAVNRAQMFNIDHKPSVFFSSVTQEMWFRIPKITAQAFEVEIVNP